jgi:hypothetical protein
LGDNIKEGDMGGAHSTHEKRNAHILLAEKSERKGHLDNIYIDERIIFK